MAWPSLPLLLGLGGAAVVVVGAEQKRAASAAPKGGALLSARPTPPLKFKNVAEARAALLPTFSGPDPFRRFASSPFVSAFGVATAEEYPAPYRLQDARAIAQIVLNAASETSPILAPEFAMLVGRIRAIDAAHLPPWRKTYALIMTVIVPAFASNMLWHWYRPKSNTKADRFNSIAAWAGLFFTLPKTATAATTIEPAAGLSSLLRGMPDYLDPSTRLRRGNLSAAEMRRCVYELFYWVSVWPWVNPQYGGGSATDDLVRNAGARMAEIEDTWPTSDPLRYVIEGNLKSVDELVWLFNARVQGSISVDFDEGNAIAALVIKVIAAVVSAVAPMVGPAVGAALTQASNALSTLAALVADGEISGSEFQALSGAGAAFMLDQAGIHLGLQDEMSKVGALVA